ncbi:PTS sugar transporter subunit IIA [Aeromicrobium camelliae]|uniref:PTS sugar transporter subunit IIA n=1 Tax=Aeromicrobium camelliae TaxID=1538144 RepID=UPI0024412084|nr:PTS glucose transporter subunit IIA [Aeromicrobium camelliae]
MSALVLHAPCEGRCVPVSEVPDPVFAEGTLGPGFAVVPTNGCVVAPMDGTITHIMPSRHGLILSGRDGVGVLIHCGIDTVQLDGRHLEAFVEAGQQVDVGTPLVLMDLDAIAAEGYRTDVIVVVSEMGEMGGLELLETGDVEAGEVVARLRRP